MIYNLFSASFRHNVCNDTFGLFTGEDRHLFIRRVAAVPQGEYIGESFYLEILIHLYTHTILFTAQTILVRIREFSLNTEISLHVALLFNVSASDFDV